MKVKVLVIQLCLTLCKAMESTSPGSSVHGILQASVTGVDSHFLLQEIFLTQGLNPSLLYCRQIFSALSHQESLEA